MATVFENDRHSKAGSRFSGSCSLDLRLSGRTFPADYWLGVCDFGGRAQGIGDCKSRLILCRCVKIFCSVPAYIYVLDMQGASLHAAVLLPDAHLGLLRTRLGSQLVAPNSHPTPLPSVHIAQDLLCTTMQ